MSAAEVLPLLKEILGRLGTIESQLGISGSGSSGGGDSGELPRSIRAYDEYSTTKVDPFVEVCNKLGGDAATLGQLVKAAWDEMRSFLLMASACKEPPQAKLTELFMKVAERQKAVANSVQRNEWEKHCKTCAEGVQALNWLMVKPAPRDFIEAYIGGSDYWANNIRREYRATNPDQVAFCDTFKAMIMELMVYVKEYHTTGVSWNPKGVDVSEYAGGVPAAVSVPVASSAPAAAPAAVAATTTSASSDSKPAVGMGNIFAGVKDGESVTSGLKKVTKDMQTWRSEYKGGEAPAPVKAKPAPASKVSEVKGTPKCEFQQAASRWQVEYQNETNGVVEINIGDIKETVYILGCAGATINVKGKCKSIIADACKKTRVTFENVFASVEVVNSQRMNIVCLEKVSSVAIDKTDGVVVTLPNSSLDSKIVASKSSEMNVSFPDDNGEMVEFPIPEQYVHQINPTKSGVTADISDLYSH